MQSLIVHFTIRGNVNGINVDFGEQTRSIEMTSDYYVDKLYDAIHNAITIQETANK